MNESINSNTLVRMKFEEHLEILRKVIMRIIVVIVLLAIIFFLNKKFLFNIILAPGNKDFITFKLIDNLLCGFGMSIGNSLSSFELISTALSAQFITHIYVSCLFAVVIASPYILFEVFRFVAPALYESEKKYSIYFAVAIFFLFVAGVLMSYFILVPISFQFLINYQVDDCVINTITLDSYISSFTTLIFVMGIVFQLPILLIILNRFGFVNRETMIKYRPYVIVVILIMSAIITPPDIFTLIIVALPMYALFELSLILLKKTKPNKQITKTS